MFSQTSDTDDALLAVLLIRTWSLISGHLLPRDVPVGELSIEELIAFWADDMSPPPSRADVDGPAAA